MADNENTSPPNQGAVVSAFHLNVFRFRSVGCIVVSMTVFVFSPFIAAIYVEQQIGDGYVALALVHSLLFCFIHPTTLRVSLFFLYVS